MFIQKVVKFFTSLRLTVVLLALAIILVFVGTIAQADEGLYNAQARYFKQWFVVGVTMFGKHLPIALPGGYLIGSLLLINLVAAHIERFSLSKRKVGITIAHLGIILLLVGQLTTDLFSRETQLRFSEGDTKSYSENHSNFELVFITSADDNSQEEIIIPAEKLVEGAEIKSGQLPFTIRVKNYWANTEPSFRAPAMQQERPPLTTNGIAQHFDFRVFAVSKRMDDKNVPTALIEIIGPNGSYGDWIVSDWAGDEMMIELLRDSYARQMGVQMARTVVGRLTQPQVIEANGKSYSFTMRPLRIYKPFSLTLLKATHSVYPGTDIPKDFRSRVRIDNRETGENREVEIFMNAPLRYGGLTFYQYQMAAGEMAQRAGQIPSSTLQVVRNPSWLTPYIGCILVGIGLTIQFMYHLVGFLSKRKTE